MAHLRCDECGSSDTNAFGSWDTPIKILCVKCSNTKKKKTFAYLGTHDVGKITVAQQAIKYGLSNVVTNEAEYCDRCDKLKEINGVSEDIPT
jgi:hypothetical protein